MFFSLHSWAQHTGELAGIGGKLRDLSANPQSRDRGDVFHSARGKGMILPDDTISDDAPIHAGL